MIKEIEIEGFRCIEKLNMKTKKINLIVGKNNTGKSSLLYSLLVGFGYISDFTRAEIENFINFGSKNCKIKLKLNDTVLTTAIYRDIGQLDNKALRANIAEKIMSITTEVRDLLFKAVEFRTKAKPSEEEKMRIIEEEIEKISSEIPLILSNSLIWVTTEKKKEKEKILLIKIFSPRFLPMISEYEYVLRYRYPLRIELRRIIKDDFIILKLPPKTSKFPPVKIYKGYRTELTEDPKLLAQIEDYIRKASIIEDLIRIESSFLIIKKKEELIEEPLDLLGDGIKALLSIIEICLLSENGIALLEEPENHMHPGLISEFVKFIVKNYKKFNIQFFISTHSLDLIHEFLQYPEIKADFQLVRMSRDVAIEAEFLSFDEAKEEEEKLKVDLRGL